MTQKLFSHKLNALNTAAALAARGFTAHLGATIQVVSFVVVWRRGAERGGVRVRTKTSSRRHG
jgi:hypothetical protein